MHTEVALGVAAVVIHGCSNRDLIFTMSRHRTNGFIIPSLLVENVNSTIEAQAAVVVGHSSSIVTIRTRFVFGIVATHAVHHPNFCTGKVRRLVVDHVVHTRRTIGLHVVLNADVTPTRTEGREVAANTG